MTTSTENQSQWYREMGDVYAKIAADTKWLPKKTANTAKAAQFYGMAERMESLSIALRGRAGTE